ncbi:MAG TPA: outer membrane protein assembly factor BamD [Polyangiaceae bacterium]|nr:outer membrane protein assembly factor BamD [Polyangiaceae bacterium]
MTARLAQATLALRWAVLVGGSSLVLGGGMACSPQMVAPLTAAEFEENGRVAYEKALETFYDRDWVGVIPKMQEVKREYAGTKWARLAQLRIADAEFHQDSFTEAVVSYREFLREFPNDPQVVYARYKVAECLFEARGESVLAPPLEERDLVNVRDADQAISDFLRDYPTYHKRERLLYMHAWVRGELARHELYVARYYLKSGRYKAAIQRTEYAITNFKETGLEPEALVLLGETYLKQHDLDQASAAFQIVIDKYPKSAFVEPARRFLNYIKNHADSIMKAEVSIAPAQPD